MTFALTFRPRALLSALVVHLTVSAAVATAAPIEIVGFDLESGGERVLATGEVGNAPEFLVHMRDGRDVDYLVDRCGDVYLVDFDEGTVASPEKRQRMALQGMRQYRSDGKSVALFTDGIYVGSLGFEAQWTADGYDRSPQALEGRRVDLPSAGVAALAVQRGAAYVIDRNGTLRADGGDRWLPIGPAGAWSGTRSAVIVSGRLYALREDGRLSAMKLDSSMNENSRPEDVATVAAGGGTLLAGFGDNLVRVSQGGAVSTIDLRTGTETERGSLDNLARNELVLSGAWSVPFQQAQYELAFARVTGDARFDACEDKQAILVARREKAAAVAQAARDDASAAVAAWTRIGEALAAHRSAIDVYFEAPASDRAADDLLERQVEVRTALEVLEREHVGPISAAIEAFLADYGNGKGSPGAHFSEATDGVQTCAVAESFPKGENELCYDPSIFDTASYQVQRVAEERQDIAERLAGSANVQGGVEIWAGQDAETRKRIHAEKTADFDATEKRLHAALSFDPENENAKHKLERLAEARRFLERKRQEAEAALANARWPSHYNGFQGPQDPEALAADALAYVNRTKGRSFSEAYVCGDWRVGKRNILEQPLYYQIVLCMVEVDADDPSLAEVSHVVLYTEGPHKGAPWDGASAQVRYRVSMDKRTDGSDADSQAAGVSAGGASGGGGGGIGVFGFLFRLVTVAALLGAGGLLAGRALVERFEALGPAASKLQDHAPTLALACLAVGGLGLLGSLVTLSPLANLLPIAALVVAGLILHGRQGAPSNGVIQAVASQPVVERVVAAVKPLAAHAQPIGFACLGLAVLHLVFGSIALL